MAVPGIAEVMICYHGYTRCPQLAHSQGTMRLDGNGGLQAAYQIGIAQPPSDMEYGQTACWVPQGVLTLAAFKGFMTLPLELNGLARARDSRRRSDFNLRLHGRRLCRRMVPTWQANLAAVCLWTCAS